MSSKNRTYQRTHPWLTFALDLRRFDPALWQTLGEAASKCEHIAGVPLDPLVADQLHRLYLAKGALATTAIEGNTLTEQEARSYLEGKLALPPSQQYLGQEIDNVVEACNELTRELVQGEVQSLNPDKIMWMNRQVLRGLPVSAEVVPGQVRGYEVGVPGYRGAPHQDCAYLLERLCATLNQFPRPAGQEVAHALIKSIFAHLYLVWIHPFGDGNGRTARLLEFFILLAAGLPQPAGHLLSNHYNKTRQEYYRQLDAAKDESSGPYNFFRYAMQGFVDGLREQLGLIRERQWEVAWKDYVYEQFRDRPGLAHSRQRNLVLRLSQESDFVAVGKLSQLSPQLAADYATLTKKAVTRDVNELLRMDLIERVGRRVRAKKGKVRAFWRNPEPI